MKIKDLVFTNTIISRNTDIIASNDRFVSYIDGTINSGPDMGKIFKFIQNYGKIKKPEKIFLGEYFLYSVDLKGMRESNLTLHDILKYLTDEKYGDDAIINLLEETKLNEKFNNELLKKDKLILISYIVISPKYMKHGVIMNELMGILRKNFLSEKTITVGYFMPIQHNNYFLNTILPFKKVEAKRELFSEGKQMDASFFYGIDQHIKNGDYEYDSLKLHSLATKVGFKPINQKNNLFSLS